MMVHEDMMKNVSREFFFFAGRCMSTWLIFFLCLLWSKGVGRQSSRRIPTVDNTETTVLCKFRRGHESLSTMREAVQLLQLEWGVENVLKIHVQDNGEDGSGIESLGAVVEQRCDEEALMTTSPKSTELKFFFLKTYPFFLWLGIKSMG